MKYPMATHLCAFSFVLLFNQFVYSEASKELLEVKYHLQVADPQRHFEDLSSNVANQFIDSENQKSSAFISSLPQTNQIQTLLKTLTVATTPVPTEINGKYYGVIKGQLVEYLDPTLPNLNNPLFSVTEFLKNSNANLTDIKANPSKTILSLVYGINGADFPAGIIFYDLVNRAVLSQHKVEGLTNYGPQHWNRSPFWLDDSSLVYVHIDTDQNSIPRPTSSSVRIYDLKLAKSKTIFEEPVKPGSEMDVWFARPTEDSNSIVIETQASEQEPARVAVLSKDESKASYQVHWLSKTKQNHLVYLGDSKGYLYFRSNAQANNLRIVRFRLSTLIESEKTIEEVVIPESNMPIHHAILANDRLIVVYTNPFIRQAHLMKIYDSNGKFKKTIPLSDLGSGANFKLSDDQKNLFFHFSSYTLPRSLMKLNTATLRVQSIVKAEPPFDPKDFAITTRAVKSSDETGTSIRYTVIEKANANRQKKKPLLFFLYGNVASVITPNYSPKFLAFVQLGGRVVIGHVRGGPERGRTWVDQGRALNKINTFNDSIRIIEHFHKANLSSPEITLLDGRSSGGFNAAAIMHLRPELFGMVAPTVPMTDMIRYPHFAWGNRWLYEYGDPTQSKDFSNLLRLSPYHNIRPDVKYPVILVSAGLFDDRVSYVHSLKYVAELRAKKVDNVFLVTDKIPHGGASEALNELSLVSHFFRMSLEN